MNTTAKEARETTVYFIEPIGHNKQMSYSFGDKIRYSNQFVTEKFQIGKTNLFDFVMESAEETTSPRGVERKLHIREREKQCSCYNDEDDTFDPDCKKCYQGTELVYDVYDWGFRGQYPKKIDTFDTEAEAEDFIFQRTYEYDFLTDNQRDTTYFETKEDAEAEMLQRYAELWSVKPHVATQILHHMSIADNIRKQRKEKAREAKQKAANDEAMRINNIASEYAKMIEKIDGESYRETAARLSAAIGTRIESKVFHAAVKIIRK